MLGALNRWVMLEWWALPRRIRIECVFVAFKRLSPGAPRLT
jgi:hypothetical protein